MMRPMGLRPSHDRVRPSAPGALRAHAVGQTRLTLTWHAAHDDRGVTGYEGWRGGRRIARVRGRRYVDRKVKAGHAYRYVVRAVDAAGNRSRASHTLVVRTLPVATPAPPATKAPAIAPGATSGGTPPGDPSPPPPAGTPLTQAMVDRVFWRAGFGPSAAERAAWTGRTVEELVDSLLSSPQTLDQTVPPPLTQTNQPIDPLVSRDEHVMEWLDTMQRATNPLTERLAFFWHRHWAVSRNDGVPTEFLLTYRNRLRRYGDLAASPDASFRDLAIEMTTQDGAMSLFLTGYANRKGSPNENYAREFMELFCLGVRDDAGADNYTQADVTQLARAFTGWRLDQTPGSPTYGSVSFGGASYFDSGTKTIFGQAAAWGAIAGTPAGAPSAIDLVLSRPAHARFLVRKLWAEFIVTPIPEQTLADLAAAYAGGGYKLRPLVRGILTHPLLFESLDEPNMVKPPVVFLVGAQKQLGAPMKWFWQREALGNMQQIPYEPPNVAGWEGGLSWLNTNTTQARFDTILRLLYLKHRPTSTPTGSSGYPGAVAIPDPGAGESAAAAVATAYAACGSPWLSAATQARLQTFASSHPVATATNRVQRQYALRALILGGPDAQVM
jgi:uncharacterized protein (DUF1800 family)